MQTLIGCAKDMTSVCEAGFSVKSKPLFADNAARFALRLMRYDDNELADMLGCNVRIAHENRLRYMNFTGEGSPLQAVLAYSGIVFKYLKASSFAPGEQRYAQQHLWITSFLYGLLRPMDGIRPYRLEGNVVLPDNGVSMFDYWKPLLTPLLMESVEKDGGVLLDLASSEMQRLFRWRELSKKVRVVRPEFYVCKNGRLKTVVVYAKMCRGAMARYAITNHIEAVEDLKSFSFEGFTYSEVESTEDNPVFVLA